MCNAGGMQNIPFRGGGIITYDLLSFLGEYGLVAYWLRPRVSFSRKHADKFQNFRNSIYLLWATGARIQSQPPKRESEEELRLTVIVAISGN